MECYVNQYLNSKNIRVSEAAASTAHELKHATLKNKLVRDGRSSCCRGKDG
jgi:hypothetical protein